MILFSSEIFVVLFLWLRHLLVTLLTAIVLKVFWSSQNGSFVFNQIFVNGTLMGVDYKSEKKI